jgi:tetrahydromethanopterin S-methyltransferase subunit F
MRDLITYFSDLIGFKSAIHSPSSEDNEYVNIYYPSMPNLTKVTTYMNDIWSKITIYTSQVIQLIKELQSGMKFIGLLIQ